MYACYADESGHCGRTFNPKQPVEVLFGVLIDLTKVSVTQREHQEILRILRSGKIALTELKAANIYRKRGAWKKVTPEDRKYILEGLVDWAIARGCKFIPCPIDSKRFFDRKASGDELANTLQNPYEAGAMNLALAIQRLQQSKKRNKGRTFLILDEQPKHDQALFTVLADELDLFDDYYGFEIPPRKRKNLPQRLDQIIDHPFFAKSHISPLVQVADVGAFIISRYLLLHHYGENQSYPGEASVITGWYNKLIGSMVSHTAIDPPGKAACCTFFKGLRPPRWSAKDAADAA